MLAVAILTAGTDTTRAQLAAAVQVLAGNPDQWALLASHPELAPNAVEEVMRHNPVVYDTIRVPVDDVALGGVIIPQGDTRRRPTPPQPTVTHPSTTSPIASTSPAAARRPC